MAVSSKAIGSIEYQATSFVAPRKIRVLLIITGLATGGATSVVLDIASYFNNHPDFDVHLLTGPVPAGKNDVTYLVYERGISTRVIPSLINRISPIANIKAVADIWRSIVQGNYDIVHTHSSVAGVVGRLAAIAAGGTCLAALPTFHRDSLPARVRSL